MGKNKVGFETEAVRREFAASKSVGLNKYVRICIIALVVAIVVFVGYNVFNDKFGSNKATVDWLAYGKALSDIETKYDDCDKIILKVGNNEVKKIDFYKQRIAQDYLFDSFTKEYKDYVKEHPDLSKEELEELKPHNLTDDEIIENLVRTELGYVAAMDAGVEMDYDRAYTQMNSMYYYYIELVESADENSEVAAKAQEFLTQAELVSKGMGTTVNDYIRYLSQDSMKSMAMSLLEEEWQNYFENSDFEGDIDEYIEKRYKDLETLYTIEIIGLE